MGTVADELRIPKLEQDNYYAWSVRAKAALIQRNCWEAIEPGYSHSPLSDSEAKSNRRALSFLLLVVSDTYLDDIGHCETAREAWCILQELNSNFGLLHVLILLKEMVNVVKTKSMSMQDYISKILNLNRKVATGGFKFDDRTLALFFLLGLPLDTYEGLVRSLEKDEENMTTKVIKSKLLLEEKRLSRSEQASEDVRSDDALIETKAMLTKGKTQNTQKEVNQDDSQNIQKQNSEKRRFVICFACGKKDHIAKNCFKRNNSETQSAQKEESESNLTDKHAGSVALNHRVLCAKDKAPGNAGTWILDSGATDHMTPVKEKLQDFQEASMTVSTANGENVQVKGYGKAEIVLKEEYGGFQLTLTNVLYVPDLQDNVLSISRIEEKGYKQIIADGRVTVTDDKTVIFTAVRKGNLYYVEEQEEDAIKSNLTAKENNLLWHKRLGHNVFPFRRRETKPKLSEDSDPQFTVVGEEYDEIHWVNNDEGRQLKETETTRESSNNSKKNAIDHDKNPRRSERLRKKNICSYCNMVTSAEETNPLTPEEALSSAESEEWYQAMKVEMSNFKRNDSWIVVERPKDNKVIGSKWVFCKKSDDIFGTEHYKARLVAQGYNQVAGVDYQETYSPVVKLKTVRVLMAIAAELSWNEEHIDVVAAYLNSTLKDTVYMEQPKFFEEEGKPRDDFVCLLLKSIYGLHQSGRNWNECIDEFLKEKGFVQSKVDDMACFGKREIIQGAMSLAQNRITSDRSKYIDVKFHFLRDVEAE